MTALLDHDSLIDRTVTEIGRLASAADGTDPAVPVPSCPEWTLSKLLKHTGTVHRMVTEMVAARATERIDHRALDLGLPDTESGYPAWLAAGAEPLAAALREAGPDAPVWAWGPEPTSGWWARRMLHETTVHRADGELATGRVPEIDPVTAADGIDELLAFVPTARAERLAGLPAGQTLHLHATDGDGEWLIRFTGQPGGIEVSHGHAKATTAVRGPADRLLLFAYGRIPSGDNSLTVFGDPELAAAWQGKAAL
ncbi:MAG: maleylpyruvate isomerase family mycothiol-dependent enzyme [Nocardiopsaceae bacterium]|nr:maleylpyruvate isomerase family mycothiol-dependent enzyme [Nocardiopsaceae bacterium]